MGEIFQFVRYDLKRLWYSPRPYVILFFVYAALERCFGCVREYLAEMGQQIQATELFSIAVSNRIPQWFLIFGIDFSLEMHLFYMMGWSIMSCAPAGANG